MEIVRLVSVLVAIIISFAYISFIFVKYGIPESISMSYYNISKKERFWFQLFIWSLSLLLVVAGWDKLFSIGAALLFVVGLTPTIEDKKKKWIRIVHIIFAFSSICLMTISCILQSNNYDLLIVICLNLCILLVSTNLSTGNKFFENIITWIEISFLLNIIIVVLINIISIL